MSGRQHWESLATPRALGRYGLGRAQTTGPAALCRVWYQRSMPRLLVLLALITSCSKQDEPPPDPLGACAKARVIFEKVDTGIAAVVAHAPDVPVDVYCSKLQ